MRLLVTLILIAAAYCGLAWDQIPLFVNDTPPPKTQAAGQHPATRTPARADAAAPATIAANKAFGLIIDPRAPRDYGENR